METTLCGLSAWEYLRTPPGLRELELSHDDACSLGLAPELLRVKNDARDADRLVSSRLLTDLKGVSTPVQVISSVDSSGHKSRLAVPHRCSNDLVSEFSVDLGNGLQTLTAEALVCCVPSTTDVFVLAKMMFEACGLFSLLPSSKHMDALVARLVTEGLLSKENSRSEVFGFSDERGNPVPTLDIEGEELAWAPAFDRKGKITDLWKRPPLTDVGRIAAALDAFELGPRHPARLALSMVHNGAASPAEAKAVMLLCSGSRFGGESWGRPELNRRIAFTPEAQRLAHTRYCIADSLWAEERSVLEVQGEAFHADEEGFRVASGRTAALESMGYSVAELLNEQMADLELFDTLLPSMAKKLGFSLEKRTISFLRRRDRLHQALFGEPYEPRALEVSARRPSRGRCGR